MVMMGEGPRLVVSTVAFHARVRGSVPGIGGLKETKMFLPTCKTQYCGKPLWPRGSVLGLRPPGLEFRILCLEDSLISFITKTYLKGHFIRGLLCHNVVSLCKDVNLKLIQDYFGSLSQV